MDVLSYRPEPAEFAWTFGGVAPVRRVRPGSILELWTEDAFGGRVRGPDDLVSRVIEFPFVNPQTGPFYVEGAEPGDTLALHFVAMEPARDFGASATIPFFGGLTSTERTATLQEALPDTTWIYELDRAKNTVTFAARHSDLRIDLPVALMERAATTGWHAANRLLERWGLRGHDLFSVPTAGRSAALRWLTTRVKEGTR